MGAAGGTSIDRRTFVKASALGIVVLGCSALGAGGLTGCAGKAAGYPHITDINDLHGMRVGVISGEEADFVLTGRNDVVVYRYDSNADMVVALRSHLIDCFATLRHDAMGVVGVVDGLRIVEPPISSSQVCAVFSVERTDVFRLFNEWVNEVWLGSSACEDLRERVMMKTGDFEILEIPETGTGETLVIGLDSANNPAEFYDVASGRYQGYEVEIIRRFANDHNYRLEYVDSDKLGLIQQFNTGMVDIGLLTAFTRMRAVADELGVCLMSDSYITIDVVFAEVEDAIKLRIVGDTENLD